MKKYLLFILINLFFYNTNYSRDLHVGTDQEYQTLTAAAAEAKPGDAIIVHNGVYTQREDISNLNGEKENPIIIYAFEEGKAIYSGQSEAWHLSSCTHLFIYGFVFEKQTGNGVNIDDSGNYDGSTYDIIIKNCVFRDMDATGNNDMLKLSGLDDFSVEECTFINGSDGGSGIDMVGCHNGQFVKNSFKNMGSNSIQVKGGSQNITIVQNTFKNGGNRSLNLGGSTGLEYFRPQDAKFEAADILVQANVFVGSWAPIAYVGSTRVKVINNTFYKPENWVFRILQETVDTSRFVACSDNTFSNNIIYFGNSLHRIVNIGPNTKPETFTFENNLWYNYEDSTFNNPNLPATEINSLVKLDPLFVNADTFNFELKPNSPAIARGAYYPDNFQLDFKDRYVKDNCTIGANEYNGIYKDFTGEIGTTWHYDHEGKDGYQFIELTDKSITNNKETSDIAHTIAGGCVIYQEKYDMFTNNHKVWIKRKDHDEFELMIDYNLKNEQEMYSITPNDHIKSMIRSVSFEYVAGEVRKVLNTSGIIFSFDSIPHYNFAMAGKIIEGINSVKSFMFGNIQDQNIDSLRCFTYFDENGNEFTEEFVDYECTFHVGIEDTKSESGFEIYPNPANDYINLEFHKEFKGKVEIFSLNGIKVLSKNIRFKMYRKINLGGLNSGTYIIKIIGNKNVNSKKIIIFK